MMVFNFLAGSDDEVMKLREKVKQLSTENTDQSNSSSQAQNNNNNQEQNGEGQTGLDNTANNNVEYMDAERYAENERITNLVMQQIKELIEIDNNLNIKIKELENKVAQNTSSIANAKSIIDEFQKKMASFDKNMEKFLGLYEIITNRFNPFVSSEDNIALNNKENERMMDIIKDNISKNKISIMDSISGMGSNQKSMNRIDRTENTTNSMMNELLSKKTIEDVENKTGLSKNDVEMLRKDIYNMINSLGIQLNNKIERSIIDTVNNTIERIVDLAVKKHITVTEQQIEAFIKKNVFDKMKTGNNENIINNANYANSELNKEVHPDFHFYLNDGTAVKSIGDLVNAIKQMDESTFMSHFSDNTNDFAEWIRLVKKDNNLADEISRMKTKEEIINKILESVK